MKTYAEINESLQQGSTKFFEDDSKAACDIWLEAWEHMKAIMVENNLQDIYALDDAYSWDEPITNWIQDLKDELYNVGDTGYNLQRLNFCKELCERIPTEDRMELRKYARWAIAESYFKLGEHEKAENEYKSIVSDEPNWEWGYIAWADYHAWDIEPHNYAKAAEILESGLLNPNIEGTEEIRARASEYFTKLDDSEKISPIGATLVRLSGAVKQLKLPVALQNIQKYNEKFAMDEIICIREHRDEAIPLLLEFVSNATTNHKNADEWREDLDYHLYAMHLLAEFGVNEAFPLFAEILELDYETCDGILGETLTEGMGSLIASVAARSDIPRIKVIVENTGLNSYHRLSAISALIALYGMGIYERDELISFLGHLLSNDDDETDFLSAVLSKCYTVSARELNPRIRELFEMDKIDLSFISQKYFTDDTPLDSYERVLVNLKEHSYYLPITDTIESMSWWACFEADKPSKNTSPPATAPTYSNMPIVKPLKIGRNEPCPCGSGKKHKKCCINKEN